jgi:hypothetical protein
MGIPNLSNSAKHNATQINNIEVTVDHSISQDWSNPKQLLLQRQRITCRPKLSVKVHGLKHRKEQISSNW